MTQALASIIPPRRSSIKTLRAASYFQGLGGCCTIARFSQSRSQVRRVLGFESCRSGGEGRAPRVRSCLGARTGLQQRQGFAAEAASNACCSHVHLAFALSAWPACCRACWPVHPYASAQRMAIHCSRNSCRFLLVPGASDCTAYSPHRSSAKDLASHALTNLHSLVIRMS